MSHDIHVVIDDRIYTVPAVAREAEDGQTQEVLEFDAAHFVLEIWRQHDVEHRKFGWTDDENNEEPETAFAVWIDPEGRLQIAYLDPFFDGLSTVNGYWIGELTQLPTIETLQES